MPKKRGRRKKFKLRFNVRIETARSAVAILLLVLSGITLISLVFSNYSLNAKVQGIFRLGFGYAFVLLIPIFFILGLYLLNTVEWKVVNSRILVGLTILLFAVSALIHTFISNDKAYEIARAGSGGGLIGYKLAQLLEGMVSVYGAVLILLALSVLAAILIINKSFDEIVAVIKNPGEHSGFLKSLPFIGKGDKTKDAKADGKADDIVIDSGMHLNTESDQAATSDDDEPLEKPSFEIIPTLAEPRTEIGVTIASAGAGTVTSLTTPGLPYSDKVWEPPPLDLLNNPPNTPVDRGDVKARARIIEETLLSFGIQASVKDYRFGPSVTQYMLEASSGTKIAKIANLQYDLALALASPTGSVRIEAPIPGKSLIGIEVPNNNRVSVYFKELISSDAMKGKKSKLTIVLGLDVGGQPIVYDIQKMPHLLIAGATGSGKSVFIHSLMASLLFKASPEEIKFILIDPKRVELVNYNGIPHLLAPVITDIDRAAATFKWLVKEMERRYKLLETAKVRNIDAYNEKSGFQALPYIVLVVDEMAEIMVADPAAVEKSIIRLAQLARATGIHLVLALQRPSTNVITGLIKANIPCRIAFNVTSQVDSRVIIDQPGAEKLLGSGDMLFVPPDEANPIRIQGAYVDTKETTNLVNYLINSGVEPSFKEDMFDVRDDSKSVSAGGEGVDDLFDEAAEIIIADGKGSASLLQRRLSIGYSRAARILDELEAKGIVGPPKGSKPREVLIKGHVANPLEQDYDLIDEGGVQNDIL